MKAITISHLRSKMKFYFDLVSESMDILIVPRSNSSDDEDAIVIMSLKEYNSLKETEYLLSSDANRRQLSQSLKEAKESDLVSFDLDS